MLITVPLLASVFSIFFALALIFWILRHPPGTEKMQEIASIIEDGAITYLTRQAKSIAYVSAGLFLILILFFNIDFLFGKEALNLKPAVGFVVGAALSGLAGYIGMRTSVKTNVRTAKAAEKGIKHALRLAFAGGSVVGFSIVGLAVLGISALYLLFGENPVHLIGFGFGACLISLFARVGGGIYTKAADVGADLVGKVMQDLPEDDPSNPAVIADNVGDNVGDCAGMGADLFETYAVTIIGAMILGHQLGLVVLYPLILCATVIGASIIGCLFVGTEKKETIMQGLYKGLIITAIFAIIGIFVVTKFMLSEIKDINPYTIWASAVIGIAITALIIMITEYFTSERFSPVKKIVKSSGTAGTNLITGLSVGLKSTFWPCLVICGGILLSYYINGNFGLYGVAISAVSMLSLTGIIVAMDAYGPITDNAGGIAKMAGLDPSVRKCTDALDSVGNTTKAVTKGFAIGSAALAALVLFAAFTYELKGTGFSLEGFTLSNPLILVGLFIGAVLPFIFSAFCMEAVGTVANDVVKEVKKQFEEIPGLKEGKAKPKYDRTIDIVTRGALNEMKFPAIISILIPLIIGFMLGPLPLGGILVGCILSGLLLAIQMTTGGAAWDNAKKSIEMSPEYGKGTEYHKNAVIGDTVGDPYKDTAGPALNPLIKVINTIALLFTPIIATYYFFKL